MKKIIVTTLICLSVVTCKQPDSSKASVTEIQTVNDSIINENLESDTVSGANPFPKNEHLPLSVLLAGTFHGDEASPEMVNKGWFGIFRDRGSYYISPTSVSIQQAYDGVLDPSENDPSTWTGWEVKTSHIDTSYWGY